MSTRLQRRLRARDFGAHRESHALREPREPARLPRGAVGGACVEPRRSARDARENDLSSIEEGKFADFVVPDRDYFSVSDADMRTTRPVLTAAGT